MPLIPTWLALSQVHCDVKASNILLKSNPRDPRGFTCKLSDFVSARAPQHGMQGSANTLVFLK
jgi:hypothetical protein